MHPILLDLGFISIKSYGVTVGLGFLLAVELIKRLAAHSKLDAVKVADLCSSGFFIGLIGARTVYVLTQWQAFAQDPLGIFRIWEGGLVFWGGPLAVIPYAIYRSKVLHISMPKLLDILTPGLVIGHAIGRWGCLFAGCCYGKPTGTSFGLRFTQGSIDPQLRGVPLHPTQLYESFSLFLLLFILLKIFYKKTWDGQVAVGYLLLYPIIRIVIEQFRGDEIRGFVLGGLLSTSEFISLLMMLFGLGLGLWFKRRRVGAP
jgi:phosphatidylglycerol---prolipoprotein diacylglyceryl transferase